MYLRPELRTDLFLGQQLCHSIVYLVILHSSIDQHSHIEGTKTDDLNGVLQTQCVPDESELKDEAENE